MDQVLFIGAVPCHYLSESLLDMAVVLVCVCVYGWVGG